MVFLITDQKTTTAEKESDDMKILIELKRRKLELEERRLVVEEKRVIMEEKKVNVLQEIYRKLDVISNKL